MSEHPLSAIAEINPPLPRHVHDSELVSFVRMTDVKESGGIATSTDLPFGSVKLGFTRFAEGDVIFAKITPCMENGKGALATGLSSGIGCGSTEFHVLRAKGENCGGYIYQVVQSREFRQKAEMNMSGSAGQQRVPSNFFKEYSVYIPIPPEQRRIAEILSTLDEAIAQTEVLIAKHQQIKAGLMHDLFTRGVTPDGHLRPTREQAPDLYKESPLGWIPKGWDLGVLQEVVNPNRPIVYGILMPGYGYEGGIPVVKVKDIRGGSIDESDLLLTSPQIDEEYKRSRLQPGDILLTIRGSVGRLAVVPASLAQANITQDTSRISIQRGYAQFYLYFLETRVARRHFEINTLGVAVQGINLGEVRKTPVPLVDLEEQERIANRIDDSVRTILREQAVLEKLRQQKHGLIHDLLTGRVRVPLKEDEEAML